MDNNGIDLRHPVCPLCGGELTWNSCAMRSQLSDDCTDDDPAMVYYYRCLRCGRNYEIVDPTKDERDGDYSAYWQEKTQTINQ